MGYALYTLLTKVNYTPMANKKNEWIVIHYTGNKNDKAKSNANYFLSVNRGASAHYFVDEKDVYQVVKDSDKAWHVGKNYGNKTLFGICNNSNSIGIEMCSINGQISDATFDNTVALTKELMKKYNIPADHVVRHFDVCNKKCPGYNGWIPSNESIWNVFKNDIKSLSTSSTKSLIKSTETLKVSDSVKTQSVQSIKSSSDSFTVKINVDSLNIRKSPTISSDIVGKITDYGIYTIVKTSGNWGKLKSGKGWISISSKYVTKQ